MFAAARRDVEVTGFARGSLAPIREVFNRMVASQAEGGAALCVYREGEPLVDLSGGSYTDDSVQLLFSVTKALSAIAVHHAAESGLIDLDEPLGAFWPAFSRSSTARITTSSVLSHRSGLASLDRELTLDELIAGEGEKAIEAQEPYWEPETDHGYHSFTYGILLDGILRRKTGATVGEYLAREISGPRGLDLWIGIPPSELPRSHRTIVSPQARTEIQRSWRADPPIPPGTTQVLRRSSELVNDPRFVLAGFPAVGGTANARSLARLFAATLGEVDGAPPVLSSAARERMAAIRSRGRDRVLGFITSFGLGMQRPFPQLPMLSPASYGHEGANGCVAFADPELGVSVGFTTSRFPSLSGASVESLALMATIRGCLESGVGEA